MPLNVQKLLKLLEGKDPKAQVHLAVKGFESAPLKPKVKVADGVVLLCLESGSEVVQILDECDIIRW